MYEASHAIASEEENQGRGEQQKDFLWPSLPHRPWTACREAKIAQSEAAGVCRCLLFHLVTSLASLAAGTNA